jgi:hypothetical protein
VDVTVVGLGRAIVASPSGVSETRVDVGANAVAGAIQRNVVAGTFRSVNVRVKAAARLVHANLMK